MTADNDGVCNCRKIVVHVCDSEARFPLSELTARVDAFPLVELTGRVELR